MALGEGLTLLTQVKKTKTKQAVCKIKTQPVITIALTQ